MTENLSENLSESLDERLESVIGGYFDASPESKCFWWEGKWYDQAFLKRLAESSAETLRKASFSEGQRLAVLMPNSPMIAALSLAVWRLGGTICPLNPKSGLPSLIATVSLLEPFAVVLSDEARKEMGSLVEEQGWPHVFCPLAGPLPEFRGQKAASFDEEREIAVIFSTSGTTGAPKAVPISHANLLNNCRESIRTLEDLREGDVLLNVLPSFHAFGYMSGTVLPMILKGSQAIVSSFLPPSNTLKAMEEARANVILLVPMMLNFLLGLIEKGAPRPEDIKLLILGGDRYNTHMEERVEKLLGIGVLEGYGLTECSPVVSFNRSYARRKLGTVGEFLGGYRWQLRDEGDKSLLKGDKSLLKGDTSLPKGDKSPDSPEEGVLWVKGPSVTKGYFRVTENDKERFDDGWFNTGDYVRVEDGYIRILDRVTDIIIVSGFNVYPQEVEGVLSQHPAVQQAVVIGIPNTSSGEVPKACIVKRPGAEVTESEIFHYCKERLAHYKVPRKVEFLEKLPVSGLGKVLRRVLRERERVNKNAE
ncbi:MAG: AMP-binding protein [Synergistaceae bacterium]|nr:AMP-binding protein [Synergistaceae bacterium]